MMHIQGHMEKEKNLRYWQKESYLILDGEDWDSNESETGFVDDYVP